MLKLTRLINSGDFNPLLYAIPMILVSFNIWRMRKIQLRIQVSVGHSGCQLSNSWTLHLGKYHLQIYFKVYNTLTALPSVVQLLLKESYLVSFIDSSNYHVWDFFSIGR